MKKRLLCLLLSVALVLSLFTVMASAESTTDSSLPRMTLQRLKEKFPAGSYWNHPDGTNNNPDGVTDTPCEHHGSCGYNYDGSCGCNSFDRAIQCMGFSRKLAYDVFGTYASRWTRVYADDFSGNIKAGDIARLTMSSSSGHSVFITAVTGDTITYADANYDQGCGIRWDVTISRTDFMKRLIYVLVSPEIPAPTAPQVTLTPECYQHDTVTATWNSQDLLDCYEVLLTCDGQVVFSGEVMTNWFTYTVETAGQYALTVTAKNGTGAVAATVYSCAYTHHCYSTAFTDVPNYDYWSHEGIDYVLQNGLFNGTSATEFEPETEMTRAMIATVLWRKAGSPAVHLVNPFVDVAKDQWYYEAVLWTYSTGLMRGVSDNAFEPENILTREQIVTVLYRYAEYCGVDLTGSTALDSFMDGAMVNDWAATAVQWAVANGVIQGSQEPDGIYIAPRLGATRAQVAIILMRFIRDVLQQ